MDLKTPPSNMNANNVIDLTESDDEWMWSGGEAAIEIDAWTTKTGDDITWTVPEPQKIKKVKRTNCANCAGGGTSKECKWWMIFIDMEESGATFYEHTIEEFLQDKDDYENINYDQARKETRYFLYDFYHFNYGGAGPIRKPLPLCIEKKIKECYPDSRGIHKGFSPSHSPIKKKIKTGTPSHDGK